MEEEKDLQETYLAGDTTLVTNQRRMNFRSFGKPLRRRERAAKPSVPQWRSRQANGARSFLSGIWGHGKFTICEEILEQNF